MRKAVVISSNNNPDYLFYVPIVYWAWAKFGWGVCFYHTDIPDRMYHLITGLLCQHVPVEFEYQIWHTPRLIKFRDETIAQCSRLYASDHCNEEVLLLTSDADMLPLSNYWTPDENAITCYGRDLSNVHQPICFVSAPSSLWNGIMNLTGDLYRDMQRDLENEPNAVSSEWSKWWQCDQNILTERLSHYSVVNVHRGIAPNSHYPLGRIDRGDWERTVQQKERIDAHLPRKGYDPVNFDKIINLISGCFNIPVNELYWMEEYRQQFIKLM